MICFSCRQEIKYDGESLKCTACRGIYHYLCVNMTSAHYQSNSIHLKKSWKCPTCSFADTRRKNDDTPVGKHTKSVSKEQLSKSLVRKDNKSPGANASVNKIGRSDTGASGSSSKPPSLGNNISSAKQVHVDNLAHTNQYPENTLLTGDSTLQPNENSPETETIASSSHDLTSSSDGGVEIDNFQSYVNTNSRGGSTSSSLEPRHLSGAVSKLQNMFACLNKNITTLTESLTACRLEMENFRSEISEMKTKIHQLEAYESEVIGLRAEVQVLRSELRHRDRLDVQNDVEITGVPEHQGEHLEHIVSVIAVKLGVDFDQKDVVFASRVGRRSVSERPRSIVLRLLRRSQRDQLLRAARVRRNLSSTDIDIPGATKNVYINERLSKNDRRLYGKLRSVRLELGLKYVWRQNGQTLVRKSDGGPIYRIETEEDLLNLASEKPNLTINQARVDKAILFRD